MAIRDYVTKAEFEKYGSVAAALTAKHRITPPRKVVIIAATKNPDDTYTVLYDVEKEVSTKKAQAATGPTEPRIAVIKIPKGVNAKSLEGFINQLAKAIQGLVFVVPMDFEVLMGNTAKDELDRFHRHIHKMLGTEPDNPDKPKLLEK